MGSASRSCCWQFRASQHSWPTETPAQSTADFDGSGKVEFADFVLFAGAFGTSDKLFDLNGNGAVDFADFLTFTQAFLVDNPPPPANITLSTTTVVFGDVETGQSTTQVVTISNSGGVELSVTGISSSDDPFAVSIGSFVVTGGGRQEVTVTFTPNTEGTHDGTLTVHKQRRRRTHTGHRPLRHRHRPGADYSDLDHRHDPGEHPSHDETRPQKATS